MVIVLNKTISFIWCIDRRIGVRNLKRGKMKIITCDQIKVNVHVVITKRDIVAAVNVSEKAAFDVVTI